MWILYRDTDTQLVKYSGSFHEVYIFPYFRDISNTAIYNVEHNAFANMTSAEIMYVSRKYI
jgi:hypothetical protein